MMIIASYKNKEKTRVKRRKASYVQPTREKIYLKLSTLLSTLNKKMTFRYFLFSSASGTWLPFFRNKVLIGT